LYREPSPDSERGRPVCVNKCEMEMLKMTLQTHSPFPFKGHSTQYRFLKTRSKQALSSNPLFKQGKKKDPGDYRQVSPISIPGKVMEQPILQTIYRERKVRKATRCRQHSFTKAK